MRLFICALLVPVFFHAAPLSAGTFRSRASYSGRGILLNKSVPGWLVALEGGRFIADTPFYFGSNIAYGMTDSGSGDDLLLLGFNFGVEKVLGRFLLGIDLGLDAAQARQAGRSLGANIVFAGVPQGVVGVVIGAGWRFAATGGYLYIPSVPQYSGATFGIRFDFKTETSIKTVDD